MFKLTVITCIALVFLGIPALVHAKLVRPLFPASSPTVHRIVLIPASDAYVRSGEFAGANFGQDEFLTVARSSSDAFSSESFLRFDLSGISWDFTSARLELVPVSIGTKSLIVHQATKVENNSWNERSITWNNRPSSLEQVGSWRPAAGRVVSVNVTPQVQESIKESGQLSLKISSLVDAGPDGWVNYGARENQAGLRPKLVIDVVSGLYPGAPGRASWESQHWSNGEPRSITQDGDEYDPSHWSKSRGIGELEVDGKGVLTFSGSQPRLYVDGLPENFWKNVEVTMYYERVSDDDTSWAGAVIGVRSGPEGHTPNLACTATTYYARLRHDGNVDFYKELKFPEGAARSRSPVWDGGSLPRDQWIGVKFIVYNLADSNRVKLELYRDLTGGEEGGHWQKLIEYVDDGGWGEAEGCSFPGDYIIAEGGGVVFIRNTGVEEARYKWVSVREIIPPQ